MTPPNEDVPGRFLLAKGAPEALVQGESAAQDHVREVPETIQMPKGAQRLQAASVLAAFLNTPAWQQAVAAGGYRSGQQIVLALETDTFTDIRPRLERCEPPVHVAVYRPSAPAALRLCFLVLEPASLDLGGGVVDPESTVGTFCARQAGPRGEGSDSEPQEGSPTRREG